MSYQDIITAITDQADREIRQRRTLHDERIRALRARHEAALAALRERMKRQVEMRKVQLRTVASTHISMERRNRLTAAKLQILDEVFSAAAKKIASLPADDSEKILRACLSRIKESGVIRPSRAHAELLKKLVSPDQFRIEEPIDALGGFRFSGKKSEADFTVEALVRGSLRAHKEVDIAHLLSSHS